MTMEAKVGVVLVNWNTAEFTRLCIASLLAGRRVPWRMVVVDNASAGNEADQLAAMFPQVEVIRNDRNLGFTGGNNIGIRRLQQLGADYIWLLNNDTEVAPDCLESLLAAMQADSGVAVASAKILYQDPPDRIWYGGGAINPLRLTNHHGGLGQPDRGQFDRALDVGYVCGCCLFVRRSVFAQVGLLHDQFFAYYEDVEWCLRLRRHHLRMRYVPSAVLRHKVAASTVKNTLLQFGGTTSPRAHYLFARNRLFVIRLHARGAAQWACALAAYAGFNVYLLAGFLARGRWPKIAALGRGLADGWRMPLVPQPATSTDNAVSGP